MGHVPVLHPVDDHLHGPIPLEGAAMSTDHPKLCHSMICDVEGPDLCICGHDMFSGHITGHPHHCIKCTCSSFEDVTLIPVDEEEIQTARTQLEELLLAKGDTHEVSNLSTPYRIRFIADRIRTGTANEGDLNEATHLLAEYAALKEKIDG